MGELQEDSFLTFGGTYAAGLKLDSLNVEITATRLEKSGITTCLVLVAGGAGSYPAHNRSVRNHISQCRVASSRLEVDECHPGTDR